MKVLITLAESLICSLDNGFTQRGPLICGAGSRIFSLFRGPLWKRKANIPNCGPVTGSRRPRAFYPIVDLQKTVGLISLTDR